MADTNHTYRIKADVGKENDSAIHVKLSQTYDTFNILSLEITQSGAYKLHQSDYGVVVGRVYANGGFGVPNAKVSIFIESDSEDGPDMTRLYSFVNTKSVNADGVRYNLLMDKTDDACHQDVGTFPNKRLLLDNNDVIEVFDKYYKYTTTTNNAGDYMLFGVPKGSQTIHMDVDLSDIGLLSQKPRDMIYKGYDANQFESPTKFKTDTNLSSLVQIMSQDAGIYVYPFWGDESGDGEEIAITRYDIELPYKFEPTCIFMGGIFTDTGSNSIGKNCTPREHQGRMSELVAGEGSVEMIRKTYDGKVEEFQVKGNRVINGDGVWCYQIPMNLDYMVTDEYGNVVPTDNPDRGIPTRACVRFRISLDETPNDVTANKRCRYLVPNNPREDDDNPIFKQTREVDYEFGTKTRNESFRDLFWNNVYTVKNYIPRIQKNARATDRRHTGIKMISHHGDNNPMPYNNLNISLTFTYRFICVLFKIFVQLIIFVNRFLGIMTTPICAIAKLFHGVYKVCKATWVLKPIGKPFKKIGDAFESMVPSCVKLDKEFCGGNVTHSYTFYPGCDVGACIWSKTKKEHEKSEKEEKLKPEERSTPTRGTDELYNCIETQLAEDNDVTSYNFHNDWVNGSLYAPMWYRHIVKKRSYFFGLFKRRAKDQWCSSANYYENLPRLMQPCAVQRNGSQTYTKHDGQKGTASFMSTNEGCECKSGKKAKDMCRCHDKAVTTVQLSYGLIVSKETILGQTVYYYKPVEYSGNELKVLFATDLVLLGSLNDCDLNGVPQFYKFLQSTTYNLPNNLLSLDVNPSTSFDSEGNTVVSYDMTGVSEASGADWGNTNNDLCGKKDNDIRKIEEGQTDGGLFFSIGCNSIRTLPKTCINLSRICELGVGEDVQISVPDVSSPTEVYDTITPDGFISFDELHGNEYRTLFATLNGNKLKTKINAETSFPVYDFRYLYVNGFDNSLQKEMEKRQTSKLCESMNYKLNYKMEGLSEGYYDFRMGLPNYYYTGTTELTKKRSFPRYENSFYFYFGLKGGKTALDRFNSDFVADCLPAEKPEPRYKITGLPNSWCSDSWSDGDGYIAFDLSKMEPPYIVHVVGNDNDVDFQIRGIPESYAKFYFGNGNQAIENDGYKQVRGMFGADGNTNLKGIPDYDTGDLEIIPDNGDSDIKTLLNGSYTMTIQDGDGEIYSTLYSHRPRKLDYDVVVSDFEDDDEVLFKKFSNDLEGEFSVRKKIAENKDDVDESATIDTRNIGGTICVVAPKNGDVDVKNFIVEIWNTEDDIKAIAAYATIQTGDDGKWTVVDSAYLLNTVSNRIKNDLKKLIFGTPKGGVNYNVSVRELCKKDDNLFKTDNVTEKSVSVEPAKEMRLLINDIDYRLIKNWNVGEESDYKDGSAVLVTNVENEGIVSKDWVKLSTANYNWAESEEISSKINSIHDAIYEGGYRFPEDPTTIWFKSIGTKYPEQQRGKTYDDVINNVLEIAKTAVNNDITTLQNNLDNLVAFVQDTDQHGTANSEQTCQDTVGYTNMCATLAIYFDYKTNYFGSVLVDKQVTIWKCDSSILTPVTTNPSPCRDADVYYMRLGDGTQQHLYQPASYEDLLDYFGDIETLIEIEIADKNNTIASIDGIIDDINDLKEMQDNIVTLAKKTFRINCESGGNDITVVLDTNSRGTDGDTVYPQYHMKYNEEKSLESRDWNSVLPSGDHNGEVGIIEGITVPTITYKGSEYFDRKDPDGQNGNYNYSNSIYRRVFNIRENENDRKYPYFVYAENKRHNTIPLKIGNATPYTPYFGFHVIDKMFRARYNTWAPVVGYPQTRAINKPVPHKYINIPGMFAGYVINGEPKKERADGTEQIDGVTNRINPVERKYKTEFVEQTVASYDLNIETVYSQTGDEDDMRVTRYVKEGTLQDDADKDIGEWLSLFMEWWTGDIDVLNDLIVSMFNSLKWCDFDYKINGNKVKPIPLVPNDVNMFVEDSLGCQLDYDLKQMVTFEVDSECYAQKRGGGTLKLTLSGFDEDDKVCYKFYPLSDANGYPLDNDNLTQKTIDGQTIPLYSIRGARDRFNYSEEKMGGSERNETSVNANQPYVYAVAEYFDGSDYSGRVNRAISPLYDFSQIIAVATLSPVMSSWVGTDNLDGGPQMWGYYEFNAKKTKVVVEFHNTKNECTNWVFEQDLHKKPGSCKVYPGNKDNWWEYVPYYLAAYPFDYSLNIDFWDHSYNVSGRVEPQVSDGYIVKWPEFSFTIDEDTYNALKKRAHRTNTSFRDCDDFTVTDITGLTHYVQGYAYNGGESFPVLDESGSFEVVIAIHEQFGTGNDINNFSEYQVDKIEIPKYILKNGNNWNKAVKIQCYKPGGAAANEYKFRVIIGGKEYESEYVTSTETNDTWGVLCKKTIRSSLPPGDGYAHFEVDDIASNILPGEDIIVNGSNEDAEENVWGWPPRIIIYRNKTQQ